MLAEGCEGLTLWVLELSLFGPFLQKGVESMINALQRYIQICGQQVLIKEENKRTYDY